VGTISWYVPKSKIKNNLLGALFRTWRAQKRSFDFGTYQLIVPALNLKTLKKFKVKVGLPLNTFDMNFFGIIYSK
jgi:hypothetical protein